MGIAEVILLAVGAYAAIGLVAATAFVTAGVQRVDHAATGSGWAFRVLILPGVAALWPLVLRKWINAGRKHEEQTR